MVDHDNSYDHYDTILCAGPHQKKEIQLRENNKGLIRKNLVSYGYPRLEKLIQLNVLPNNDRKVILLAPTGERIALSILLEWKFAQSLLIKVTHSY